MQEKSASELCKGHVSDGLTRLNREGNLEIKDALTLGDDMELNGRKGVLTRRISKAKRRPKRAPPVYYSGEFGPGFVEREVDRGNKRRQLSLLKLD